VSLTVFDHGDGVTHSSHCLSSPAKDTHSFGGWICCMAAWSMERDRFLMSPLTLQILTVEFTVDLGCSFCYR